MMNVYARRTIAACLLFVLFDAGVGLSQPQIVPRLTERELDQASYVELAREWKEYIAKHGESPVALVNLGMAYEYAGEVEAAYIAGKRAVEIAPEDAAALAFLGKILSKYKHDTERATELLERCRGIAPDHEHGLKTLVVIYNSRGELAKSEEVLKTIFRQRVIPRPLEDYAYNMLVGLPQGAVLITNGDNDTFPPLALQAGMGFRSDVAVVNRHLLNVNDYVEALFERYPSVKPGGRIEAEDDLSLSSTLLKRMIDEQKAPVYFAASVDFGDLGFSPELVTEGMNLRASGKGLTPEESARLFLEKYRLDSATDWSFSWDLVPGHSRLLANYISCVYNLANQEGVSADTMRLLLDKALDITEFHEMDRLSYVIKSLQKK
ncbi:MAG: hypothetical protein JSW58_07320 [Candidatus Latescibacterota bacterium]|nr:MAG: hypothetical protein JSW58_07320 [Candidatus Latescibacterota bacterium]